MILEHSVLVISIMLHVTQLQYEIMFSLYKVE